MKVNSVNMTLDDFNLALFGETGIPNNQLEVLKLILQALEEKALIFLTDKSTGKKYQLSENGRLIEIKT